jgi:RimJ/RimL family protein N-acetyltransferase
MRAHVDALYTHDDAGRMLRGNYPGGEDAPRFFLGRTAHGNEWRFRHDVTDAVRHELELLSAAEPVSGEVLLSPHGSAPYENILAQVEPIRSIWSGPAYGFPDELPPAPHATLITQANRDVLRPHLDAWLPDVAIGQPLIGCIVDGHAVSVCGSVRITAVAHEAGVETAPNFRGRGFAIEAVAAWARAVRDIGRIPLYSTSWQNVASQAVAARLRLVRFGADLHIT